MRLARLAGPLTPLYTLYHRTLRIRVVQPAGDEVAPEAVTVHGKIFALSEADAVALAGVLAGREFVVLVARGRDGDWASEVLRRIGCTVVRGSSRHDPERALKELLAMASTTDRPIAIVVDGPLGPAGAVQPGAVYLAQGSQRPIVLLAAAASTRMTVTRSWSRLYVPAPWSRVVIASDHAVRLPGAGVGNPEEIAEQLSLRLTALRSRADSCRAGPCARIGPLVWCDRVSIESSYPIDRKQPLGNQSTEQCMGVDLWSRVHRILVDFVGPNVAPESITQESRLREDLGLSSLRTIDLVIRFEDAFDTAIPEDELGNLTTVGDLVQALSRHLADAVEPG